MTPLTYYRGRWPDEAVPDGEPLWLLYEVDEAADGVLRSVEVFPDGRVARNSVALEACDGRECASLFDIGWREAAAGTGLERISSEAFETLYRAGADTPFWFPR